MLEARTFVNDFDKAREVLKLLDAELKGEYEIHDMIFSSKDRSKTLVDEFLRLRIVPRNIWDEKPFIVAIKNTEVREIGKDYTIPLKKQFDSKEEAQKFIDENLLDKFEYSFEFSRIGEQYDFSDGQVDLEDIEGFLSIEIKSKTEEGLKRLAELFDMHYTLKGPSVVAVKELLKK